MSFYKKGALCLLALFTYLLTTPLTYVYLTQEKQLFRASPLPLDYTFSYKQPHEELFFETEKGASISALYFTTPRPKGAVFYLHGRGSNLSTNWGERSEEFTSRGYNLLVMDYRGFGKSRGRVSERALYHDAHYCYAFLTSQFPEEQLILYGRSLGTAIATYVAALSHAKALILEAPYLSMLEIAQRRHPYLPSFLLRFLIKYPLHTAHWIQHVTAPICIFHGVEDALIPYTSSIDLIEYAKQSEESVLIPLIDGEHDHLRHHPDYQLALTEFLQ